MKPALEKWPLIDRLAEDAGVSKETRKKWRSRGVPSVWKIKLVRSNPGTFSFEDFDAVPPAPRQEGAAA